MSVISDKSVKSLAFTNQMFARSRAASGNELIFTYGRAGDGWNEAVNELQKMKFLQDDWDGAGSVAPVPCVLQQAICFADAVSKTALLDPPTRVFVTVNGAICFEWWLGSGKHREIEFDETGYTSVLIVNGQQYFD